MLLEDYKRDCFEKQSLFLYSKSVLLPLAKWIGGRELPSWQFGGGRKFSIASGELKALNPQSSILNSQLSRAWEDFLRKIQVWLKACTMSNRGRAEQCLRRKHSSHLPERLYFMRQLYSEVLQTFTYLTPFLGYRASPSIRG